VPGGDRAHRPPFDTESAVDELYTTSPTSFVARRDELARQAKAAGDATAARLLRGLHRPTLAAWASNLLVRAEPDQVRGFLELGEALRAAHRDLDRQQMRELSAQQGRIITALTGQAAHLAAEAGHRLSDTVRQDVANTLRAVLADAQSAGQWAAARLSTALTPPTEITPAIAARKPPQPEPAPTPQKPSKADAARRKHQEKVTQAHQEAESAAKTVRTLRREQEAAAKVQDRAAEQAHRARQRVEAAEQELQQAKSAARDADRELQEARDERHSADEALADAETAEHRAARALDRLTRNGRHHSNG